MLLHRKLIWYVHFLTSCNHVCERSVSWKVLENEFFGVMENPEIWFLQILESPGKQCFNVCTSPDLRSLLLLYFGLRLCLLYVIHVA